MYKIEKQESITTSSSGSWERIYSLNPSGYIRKGTLQVFHKIRRNYPKDHILCIGYNRNDTRDTQFAITETFKTYERSVEEVVDRCLREEVSMERINTESALDFLSFEYHEKFATIYCVPLRVTHENLQPCLSPLDTVAASSLNDNDDKTRKLVLFLHGPLEILQPLFSRFYSIESEISHLVAIPVDRVTTIFPKLFPLSLYPLKKSRPMPIPFLVSSMT